MCAISDIIAGVRLNDWRFFHVIIIIHEACVLLKEMGPYSYFLLKCDSACFVAFSILFSLHLYISST